MSVGFGHVVVGVLVCVFLILSAIFGGLWASASQENKHFKPTDCFVVDNGISEHVRGCTCCCSHQVPAPCPPPPPDDNDFGGGGDDLAKSPSGTDTVVIMNEVGEIQQAFENSVDGVSDKDDKAASEDPKLRRIPRPSHAVKSTESYPDFEAVNAEKSQAEKSRTGKEILTELESEESEDEINAIDFNFLQETEFHDESDSVGVNIQSQFCPNACFTQCCTSRCCNIVFTCYSAFWDVIVFANDSTTENNCPSQFDSHILGSRQGSSIRPIASESKTRAERSRDLRPPNSTETCYFDLRDCSTVRWVVQNPDYYKLLFIVFISIAAAGIVFPAMCYFCSQMEHFIRNLRRRKAKGTDSENLTNNTTKTPPPDFRYSKYEKL